MIEEKGKQEEVLELLQLNAMAWNNKRDVAREFYFFMKVVGQKTDLITEEMLSSGIVVRLE